MAAASLANARTISGSTSGSIGSGGQVQPLRNCVGCSGPILDQYILRVAPNLEWHAACLKCCQCQKFLDEKCTCFVRDGKIFCKEDYVRLFGTKCEKCTRSFGTSDFVMRAKNKIFHLECFRCVACDKQLVPGDEFALRPDGLFCKEDHSAGSLGPLQLEENNNNNNDQLEQDIDDQSQDGDKDLLLLDDRFADSGMDDLGSEKSPCSSVGGISSSMGSDIITASGPAGPKGSGAHGGHNQRRSRAGRVRTVLTEKQLSLLKSCYNANPRPDALMKEQMVEMSGLSPRVIRVWFQNKRCKDKKRQILHQSKEGRKLGYSAMPGVPMVATSPMRHDLSAMSPNGGQPIHSYEPPWKALCDFALHSDLDRPGYNHLVSEMHGGGGYDYSRLPPPAAGPDRDMGFMPDHPAASVGGILPDYMETPVGTTPSSLEASSAPPLPPPISDSYTLTSLDCGSCES